MANNQTVLTFYSIMISPYTDSEMIAFFKVLKEKRKINGTMHFLVKVIRCCLVEVLQFLENQRTAGCGHLADCGPRLQSTDILNPVSGLCMDLGCWGELGGKGVEILWRVNDHQPVLEKQKQSRHSLFSVGLQHPAFTYVEEHFKQGCFSAHGGVPRALPLLPCTPISASVSVCTFTLGSIYRQAFF